MSMISYGPPAALLPAARIGYAATAASHRPSYESFRPPGATRVPAWHVESHEPWSEDDLQLVALFAEGLPVEAIARRLDLSDRTIRRRSRAMCDRLGVKATVQVVAWAARHRLI